MLRLGIKGKILLPILLIGILVSIAVNRYMLWLSARQVSQTTVDAAANLTAQISEVRAYYTKNVVANVLEKGVPVTHDYAKKPGALPLPATLVHELNEVLSKKQGYTVRLYSQYPFPFRQNGGAHDKFEQEALESLAANPQKTFYRLENYQGVPSMRYVSADIMVSNTCVTCHNTHPASPKTDWRLGDVRGALEVIIPVDRALTDAKAGAWMASLLVSGGMLLVLLVAAFIAHRLAFKPLKKISHVATGIAVGNIDQTIDHRSGDEIGILADAFRRVTETLRELMDETTGLVRAAQVGKLNQRGNADKFQGGFHELVQGINKTLDAVVAPIDDAAQVLERVAAGDLTARVTGDYQGDYAKIKDRLNATVQHLEKALAQAAVSADQVAGAATQISSGSESLAQGAAEQASSLEEVASSLQEMTSMTRQNAAHAREARSLSDSARTSAEKGAASMRRLSEAIDQIKTSSGATAKIVKTIDEIAFQTNLLALNAAVEAARAGDAGKGFAVVADEVRNLAMRCAEAAKSTAALIDESVRNAEGGVTINKEALQNLGEINAQVEKVSEMMAEVAAASEQQSQGVDQINIAVEQMNQVTQQTAATAEESAAEAQELSRQARELQNMVNTFRLTNASDTAPTRQDAQARPTARTQPMLPSQQKKSGRAPARGKTTHGPGDKLTFRMDPNRLVPLDDDADNDLETLQDF